MKGFTIRTIPERKYRSCIECDYHKSQLVRSGRNPIYKNECHHPDLDEFHRPDKFDLTGNIGEDAYTPSWCPFLIKNQKK